MRPEKKLIVDQIEGIMNSDHFFLISFMGLSVAQQEELKKQLKDTDSGIEVHKNSLLKKAAANKDFTDLAELKLTGGTAIVYTAGEPGDCAKAIKTFGKANEQVQFKAAYVDGQYLAAADAAQVAGLPTKDEARAMLLRTLLAAPQNVVGVLNNAASSIVNLLSNLKDSKEA